MPGFLLIYTMSVPCYNICKTFKPQLTRSMFEGKLRLSFIITHSICLGFWVTKNTFNKTQNTTINFLFYNLIPDNTYSVVSVLDISADIHSVGKTIIMSIAIEATTFSWTSLLSWLVVWRVSPDSVSMAIRISFYQCHTCKCSLEYVVRNISHVNSHVLKLWHKWIHIWLYTRLIRWKRCNWVHVLY